MFAVSPANACEWDVTNAVFNVVDEPYDIVVPYSTCVSLFSFVVHVIVAPVVVKDKDVTDEIIGGVVSGATMENVIVKSLVFTFPAVS